MGLEMTKMPEAQPDAGIFNLPPEFDTTKFAAQWTEESKVESAQQRQHLLQTKYTADGWSVWKKNKNSSPTVVSSGSKKYVLMCRSRKVQDEVNKVFGNVTKEMINHELTGETIAGESPTDTGMLPEQRLKDAGDSSGMNDGTLPLNKISTDD